MAKRVIRIWLGVVTFWSLTGHTLVTHKPRPDILHPEHNLAMSWAHPGHILATSWSYLCHILSTPCLDKYWPHLSQILITSKPHPGHTLATYWPYPGYILWSYTDHILVIHWPQSWRHPDHILVTPWWHPGHFLSHYLVIPSHILLCHPVSHLCHLLVEIYKIKRDNLTSYNPHNGGPTWTQWQYNYTKFRRKFSIALI